MVLEAGQVRTSAGRCGCDRTWRKTEAFSSKRGHPLEGEKMVQTLQRFQIANSLTDIITSIITLSLGGATGPEPCRS